ncbi:1671_t:CDS:1, partial [Dentiscutata heterogama]
FLLAMFGLGDLVMLGLDGGAELAILGLGNPVMLGLDNSAKLAMIDNY